MPEFKKYILDELHLANKTHDLVDFFLSPQEAIIFGAGQQSLFTAQFCQFFQKKIKCFLTSNNGYKKHPFFNDIPVITANSIPYDLDKASYDVILAIHETHHDAITLFLKDLGFTNIFTVSSWKNVNEFIPGFWYEKYFSYRGAQFFQDADDEQYIKYKENNLEFYYYLPVNDIVFRDNLTSNSADIVLPSIFKDYRYQTAGAYEIDDIAMNEGDVVLDIGACLGQFSSVAVAKGCRVHAFEPSPRAITYFNKSMALYKDKEAVVHPYVVLDKTGRIDFYVNEEFIHDNLIIDDRTIRAPGSIPEGFKRIEAKTISIDTFVEKYNIPHVDFIKIHVEGGTEKLILAGAKKTLQDFSPKIVTPSYHTEGDTIILADAIRKINPKYKISHKKEMLFAYRPDK